MVVAWYIQLHLCSALGLELCLSIGCLVGGMGGSERWQHMVLVIDDMGKLQCMIAGDKAWRGRSFGEVTFVFVCCWCPAGPCFLKVWIFSYLAEAGVMHCTFGL